jgi:hypothetical protein
MNKNSVSTFPYGMENLIHAAIFIAMIVVTGSRNLRANQPQFEYLISSEEDIIKTVPSNESLNQALNKLGEKGWELVQVDRVLRDSEFQFNLIQPKGGTVYFKSEARYIFRRIKTEQGAAANP